jgi:hypothetical protein
VPTEERILLLSSTAPSKSVSYTEPASANTAPLKARKRVQADEPNAFRILFEKIMSYLKRKTCFADTANTHERDKSILCNEIRDLCQFFFAPNERCQRSG